VFAIDTGPLVGIIAGVFAVGVTLAVVAGPGRRVRDEAPLDEDVETRILMGEDPDAIERDLEEREEDEAAPVSDLRPEE
jgi:hypothetical protein